MLFAKNVTVRYVYGKREDVDNKRYKYLMQLIVTSFILNLTPRKKSRVIQSEYVF